jgi:hypothetical protein
MRVIDANQSEAPVIANHGSRVINSNKQGMRRWSEIFFACLFEMLVRTADATGGRW